MDKELATNVMRILIGGSPAARPGAFRLMTAISRNDPYLQRKVNRLVKVALDDPDQTLSYEDIKALINATGEDTTGRNFMLRVKLTQAEKTVLQGYADHWDMTLSDAVRSALGGVIPRWPGVDD